jgi:hypothetical protein
VPGDWVLSSNSKVDYAAAPLTTPSFGLETTNRKEGLRPLGPEGPYDSQQFLEGFAFHGRDVAIVVQPTLLPRNRQVTT